MIYTDIKNGRFYNEDCFDAMREIPDGVIDMCITSPPYDNLRNYNDSLNWTFDIFKNVAIQITRLIKEGGIIVWNVGDETIDGSETGTSFRQALFFKDVCGLKLHDTMIWNKQFAFDGAKTRYANVFEYMFIFSKGKISTFNPLSDRNNISKGRSSKGTRRQKDGSSLSMDGGIIKETGKRFNIWNQYPVMSNKERQGHPAQFPEALAQDHILTWSNQNDCILDPFGGSGTTAIAAINTNRKWVCIEKEETYYSKALERITNHAH